MSQKAADQKQRPKSDTIKHALVSHKWLYLMLIPGVLYMLIFNYLPMGGLVMAFQEFSPYNGDSMIGAFLQSPFVGLSVFYRAGFLTAIKEYPVNIHYQPDLLFPGSDYSGLTAE